MYTKWTLNAMLIVGLAVVAMAPPRSAQAQEDALFIYSAGIDRLLVDEKDEGLRNAMKMIGSRIMELPAELDEPNMPAPLIAAAVDMLMSPISFRGGMMDEPPLEHGPPFYAQITVTAADRQAAQQRADMFVRVLEQSGQIPMEPAPGLEGVFRLDLDGVPGYLGATSVGGEPSLVAALSRVETEAPAISTDGLPPGVEPAFAFRLDSRQLAPLMEMILAQMPPSDAEMFRMQLEMMGIGGEEPMAVSAVYGYGPERSHMAMRYANYAAIKTNAAMIAATPLTLQDLKMIPRDVTFAQAWRVNMAGLADVIRAITEHMPAGMSGEDEGEPVDPIEMLAGFSGVHLEHDILDHLGEAGGTYMSDRTGGGGLMSLVSFIEVTDEAALRETLNSLTEKANSLAAAHARGYIRITERELDGRRLTTLMFPGLPVPLELSWTIDGGYLWMGASPQTVLAGMAHAASRGASLLDNPAFAELVSGELGQAMSLTFLDTPRLAGQGYGWLSVGMSALSNALRSPSDPDRDPGLIMPSFSELTKDAKCSLTVTRLDGDDLVTVAQGDRSALVNLSAGIAMLGNSYAPVMMAALGAGVAMPALAKAREQAKMVKSSAQLKQIAMCMTVWASEHNDQLPPDMQALVDAEYCGPDLFVSPLGPVLDDGGDYWINPYQGTLSQIQHPDRMIAGYDRAAYVNHRQVPVLFFDGHVEMLEIQVFMERLEDPIHEGIDFQLP